MDCAAASNQWMAHDHSDLLRGAGGVTAEAGAGGLALPRALSVSRWQRGRATP